MNLRTSIIPKIPGGGGGVPPSVQLTQSSRYVSADRWLRCLSNKVSIKGEAS